MKEAGCRLMIVGYESGDPQILKNITEAESEFQTRRKTYFSGQATSLSIDDVLTSRHDGTLNQVWVCIKNKKEQKKI